MRTGPPVSAIIPTFNRAGIVGEAVDSVLNQTYQNVEVIVVDDGSTDDTREQLSRYGDRIRVVTQGNAGPAAARNHGIAVSRGELIAFLDSDDLWLPTKLERQVALLQKLKTSVTCCLCNITMRWRERESTSFEIAGINPSVKEGIWRNVDEVLATRFLLFNQGIMIRRSILERIGGFDETLWLLEDYEFALRLSLEGAWAFIREPLVIWRETKTGSLSQSAQREELPSRKAMVEILEKHVGRVNERHQHASLERLLNRELKRARRQLRATEMSKMSFWGASATASSLRKIEQYRKAIYHRSPWFPRMSADAGARGDSGRRIG